MPGRPEIVRLLALATFISVVALATWLAELSRALVIASIAAALAVAWTIEWFAWREMRLRIAQKAVAEDEAEEEAFLEEPVAAAAVAEPARSGRSRYPLRKMPRERDQEEAPRERPLAPAAPVVEGRARVVPADTTPAEAVSEPATAEPPAPEQPEPVAPETAPPPVAAPAAERAPLRPVPPPPPAAAPVPEEAAAVVNLAARARGPRTWNLWELERLAREEFKGEALEQSQYLFIHLRQFARADGQLPLEFDELVRDSFGGLLERLQHA